MPGSERLGNVSLFVIAIVCVSALLVKLIEKAGPASVSHAPDSVLVSEWRNLETGGHALGPS
jgi:hypothetical protein